MKRSWCRQQYRYDWRGGAATCQLLLGVHVLLSCVGVVLHRRGTRIPESALDLTTSQPATEISPLSEKTLPDMSEGLR